MLLRPFDISPPKIINISESGDEEQDENQQNDSVPIVMSPIIVKPPNRDHSLVVTYPTYRNQSQSRHYGGPTTMQ